MEDDNDGSRILCRRYCGGREKRIKQYIMMVNVVNMTRYIGATIDQATTA